VHATGGLADTVEDARPGTGTGFVFYQATSEALVGAMMRARRSESDTDSWRELQRRAMACEFSWEVATGRYEALYQRLLDPTGAAPEAAPETVPEAAPDTDGRGPR
jgi:starch synthase